MKITSAQANALKRLFDQGYQVDDVFNPYDAFPERDAMDNGARRALNGLAQRKILVRVTKPMGWLRIMDEAEEKLCQQFTFTPEKKQ